MAIKVRVSPFIRRSELRFLGQLSEQQATQIKLILRTLRSQDDVLVALDDVVPNKALDYLDVAVANRLWDDWNLDSAFVNGTDSALTTSTFKV